MDVSSERSVALNRPQVTWEEVLENQEALDTRTPEPGPAEKKLSVRTNGANLFTFH